MLIFKKQTKGKVYVGLSGGVDSAVSAALLVQDGWEVVGVFIKIQILGYPCPAAQDRIEAMRVAAHLRIPFIEIDLSKEYQEAVFAMSLREFALGHTPNPDALCNREIKFGAFYNFARAHGADFVATGHYAQVEHHEQGSTLLKVSTDENKDQSYFLWAVPQEVLRHTLFPIGFMRKEHVRVLAKKFRLPNAARSDSQGLCFLGDISIEDMLQREDPQHVGDVLSEPGDVVGTHDGTALYTLGQRHGFTLFPHTSDTSAHYVTAKDILKNTITVSPNKFPRDARRTEIILRNTNWIGPSFTKASEGTEIMARYRYRQKLISAELSLSSGQVRAILNEPHYVPLGQSLVVYIGERCVGGGVIESATLLP